MRTRVKICGITRVEDAALALSAGADAVGFVFWSASPRFVAVSHAAEIATDGALVARVGVFVDASPETVAETVRGARLSAVQLHGDERTGDYARSGAPIIKAIALRDSEDVDRALRLPAEVTVLVDASDNVRRGGTGNLADWSLARAVSERRPVILAGGLSASNVADAIRRVRPWAIDVSSGVESSPGVKSPDRLRDLFAAVAAVEGEK